MKAAHLPHPAALRTLLRGGFILGCLLAALPLPAQTLLLVVRENVDGRTLAPPLPVREGLSANLFDAGFIVLDAPGSTPIPGPADLATAARSAGADAVLVAVTDYADQSLGADLRRISARTSYALIDASTGGTITKGTLEDSNRNREREVDRAALGAQIGRAVVERIRKALAHGTS